MCLSWKMMNFVNGVGMTSHVWNGKLKMFQTTNQYIYISGYIWVIYPHFPRLFLWFTCSFHPMLIKYGLIPYQVIQTWLDRILDTAEPWLGPDSWSTPSMGCSKNTYIGVLSGYQMLSGCKHNVKIQETHGFQNFGSDFVATLRFGSSGKVVLREHLRMINDAGNRVGLLKVPQKW